MQVELTESEIESIISAYSACSSESIGPDMTRELADKLGLEFRHYLYPRNAEERAIVQAEDKARYEFHLADRKAKEDAWNALTDAQRAEIIAERDRKETNNAVDFTLGSVAYLRELWKK